MSNSEENAIISNILAGDADAFAILVKRYQKPVFNLMIRITSCEEDAFDLTQDTFIRAYEKLETDSNPLAVFSPGYTPLE